MKLPGYSLAYLSHIFFLTILLLVTVCAYLSICFLLSLSLVISTFDKQKVVGSGIQTIEVSLIAVTFTMQAA